MNDASRQAEIQRKTNETDVALQLDLDGNGRPQIDTGIPFFDHVLTLLAWHSLCDLSISALGDVEVDDHHTVEDTGICLGQAIKQALGDKKGINRYGEAFIPMDGTLVRVVLDLSGRSYLVYNVQLTRDIIGNLATENVREFFQALSSAAGMNLHIDLIRGSNNHHIVEAIFKAFARAFKTAITIEPRLQEAVWSSKGSI